VGGGQVKFVTDSKGAVQLRVEVLGYAINGTPVKVHSSPSTRIVKAKMDGSAPMMVGPVTGLAGISAKAKKVSAVILQVQTKGLGADGTLKVYGSDRSVPSSRSAAIQNGKPYTTLLVAELGTDGKLAVVPSVAAKVKVTIVGWVHR
jgi:protein-disulfide isomerase